MELRSRFLVRIVGLDVFPMFVGYMIMCFMAPVWKRNTQPMKIRPILVPYNFLCSILNLYAFVGMVIEICRADVIYTNTPTPGLIPYFRVYAFTKILELSDTVFMILRHKTRQISFLHIFHHSTMLLLIHYALQYSPWTALAPGLALNSLVHVVLYFYYGYTAHFATHQPTWKRRITELQIVQFLIDLVYCSKGIIYHDFCIWSILYGSSMLVLFVNFYIKAYMRPIKSGVLSINSSTPKQD